MSGGVLLSALPILRLMGFGAAMVKIWMAGLQHRYHFIFLFFALRVVTGIPLLLLPLTSHAYFYLYVVGAPITWICWILIVRELFGLVFERHKGLSTVGRWAMYAGAVLSMVVSILTLIPKLPPAQRSHVMIYLAPLDRGLSIGLVVFLLLMMLWLSRYPVQLNRN